MWKWWSWGGGLQQWAPYVDRSIVFYSLNIVTRHRVWFDHLCRILVITIENIDGGSRFNFTSISSAFFTSSLSSFWGSTLDNIDQESKEYLSPELHSLRLTRQPWDSVWGWESSPPCCRRQRSLLLPRSCCRPSSPWRSCSPAPWQCPPRPAIIMRTKRTRMRTRKSEKNNEDKDENQEKWEEQRG